MNLRLPALIVCSCCALLSSCTPYNENQDKKPTQKPAPKTVTSPEQQKIKEQRDALKEKQATQKQDEVKTTPEVTGPPTTPGSLPPTPPVEEKRQEYKFANKVPGKDGFVFSPYNNKIVDVTGIPSGTLVQDPTYTGAGKGYFRVP